MTYCPNGVNQPRTQKKRIAWEMEKSWVKKTRKAVFLDDLPEKHQTGPEIITKNGNFSRNLGPKVFRAKNGLVLFRQCQC